MKTIFIGLLVILGAFLISLFFEEARDWYSETLSYIGSFEWWSDFREFIGSMFENITELSAYGTVAGILAVVFIFIFRKNMIYSFTQYMPKFQQILIPILVYVLVFVACYFIGKHFENTA